MAAEAYKLWVRGHITDFDVMEESDSRSPRCFEHRYSCNWKCQKLENENLSL